MYLKRFNQQGVRNLVPCQFELDPHLNIFHGDNGAGKSSLLEAISLLTSGRSFRTAKLERVLSNQAEQFVLFGLTDQEDRLGLGFDKANKKKAIKINGEKAQSLSALTRLYPTQVLSPESYDLIDAGPAERRKYLDWCLFHVEHSFLDLWKAYYSVLKQRNALLRHNRGKDIRDQLTVWDKQLCDKAVQITQLRQRAIEQLDGHLQQIITDLAVCFDGEVRLNYYPGYSGDLETKLIENYPLDNKSGFTRSGPHKGDIKISVNGELAKEFLSRGQKKVLINILYLAQTRLLKSHNNKDSLFVIDDFTSELDLENQQALLSTLLAQDNVQIILSCLHLESLKWVKTRYNNAHMFHVKHGNILPVKTTETN